MEFFKKYSSIENTYDSTLVEKINTECYGEEFVCEEKVHGSNMSLVIDRDFNVSAAKRTGIIAKDESFYNYERAVDKVKDNVLSLVREIMSRNDKIVFVSVFGELCGGHYPSCEIIKNVSLVQKGIYYNPDQCFVGFDICLNYSDGLYEYLSVDDKYELFEKFNIPYTKELFRGTLKECVEYTNEFPSTIPAQFGLPVLEDNLCEGTVIKPVKCLFLRNGSRAILKNKNKRFSEIKNSRSPKNNVKAELPEHIGRVLETMRMFINENRLNNVVSKIGEVSIPRDLGKLTGFLTKDALEDFMKMHGNDFDLLEKDEKKKLQKMLSNESMQFVKSVYMK